MTPKGHLFKTYMNDCKLVLPRMTLPAHAHRFPIDRFQFEGANIRSRSSGIRTHRERESAIEPGRNDIYSG